MKTIDQAQVTKAAVDPVWYLPGICERLGVKEHDLRRCLFEQTGGMFPELITRYDLEVFLPPIGGITVYIFGDPSFISDPTKKLAVRVHDECNGSDVFGSDICTCRPYLVHGVETCVKTAQEGGAGVIVYYRKEGRGLGEVVKYLVYNARKRSEGGDTAAMYFNRTKCVAGVEDARMQPLMPDILHWLGITKIDRFVSMSDDKYDAITGAGIKIIERIAIPPELIPADAHVEINAKIAKGYFTPGHVPTEKDLVECKGRGLAD
jgi:GTP cyclohydrolase II